MYLCVGVFPSSKSFKELIIEVVNFDLGFTISCLQTELGSKFQLLDPLPKIGDVGDKGVIRGLYGGSAIK